MTNFFIKIKIKIKSSIHTNTLNKKNSKTKVILNPVMDSNNSKSVHHTKAQCKSPGQILVH
jgi:hypothetical protein